MEGDEKDGRKKWKMDEWRGMRWMGGRNGKWMSGGG